MTSTDAGSHHRTRARRLGRAAAYGAVTAAAFFAVGFLVRSRWNPLIDLDTVSIRHMTDFTRSHPALRSFLITWQAATQPVRLHPVGILVCLWVWLGRGLRTRAWWAFATLMMSWFIGYIAKEVFQRARPVVEDPVSTAPGFSFPSGHALNSAAWAATLVVLVWPIVKNRGARWVMVGLAVVIVLVTALDRTFLGVHYPSDVTVGVLTGIGLVLASYAGYAGWNPRDITEAHDPDLDPHNADEDIADDRRTTAQER